MRYLFFLFSLFFLFCSQAQTLRFIDAETKEPLEFVSITGLSSNQTISSNKTGYANLSILQHDTSIVISLLGYQNQTHTYSELKKLTLPIELKRNSFSIGEIVISATKWAQESQAVPHKISSIDRKAFQFLDPQTSADLLEESGEVFIQKSQQGGGSPMIRGFAANRLLYAVDGVRMNTAIFRSGNLQNVISLDPFSMEKVEVLFGPGAITYGSDAIGGVMNFSTLQPKLASDSSLLFDGNIAFRTSTANSEISTHVDFNIGTKKWSFLSSFSRTDYGDLTMGKNGPNDYLRDSLVVSQNGQDFIAANSSNLIQAPSNYSQTNLMQKVLFQPNSNYSLVYGFHLSETSSFDRYDRLLEKSNGTFSFAEWKYGPQKWQMHHLEAQFHKKTALYEKAKLSFAYQYFNESRIDRTLYSEEREIKTERVNAYSLNLDFKKKLGALHQLFYGYESVFNTVGSDAVVQNIQNLSTTASLSRYPESNWFSNAIYVTDHLDFNSKLHVEAGLRLNHFGLNSTFDTSLVSLAFEKIELNNMAVNASLGAVYTPNENWALSSNFSTGFRAPNVDDVGKFDNQREQSIVVPNQHLDAEYAYNMDVGVSKIVNPHLKIDLTFFYTFLEDAMVRRSFTFNGSDRIEINGESYLVESIQNAASANVYGFQAGIEFKLNKDLSFSSKISFQKGEEEMEDGSMSASRHAAPLFSISRLNYTLGKFLFQVNLQYSGEVAFSDLNVEEREKVFLYASDENGNPYSPSWYSLGIKTQIKLSSHVSGNLGIENITDQRYRPYSSGIAAAGRNFVFSFSANF